jgi:excisionase family DNA binding protein
MAQKYYNTKEAAEVLGLTIEEVKAMLDARQLHGYRDGADWKFKTEDIERVAKERKSQPGGEDENSDVLLSEVELGGPAAGASGTVIGMQKGKPASADSDLMISGSGAKPAAKPAKPDAKASQFEELDLTLDEDLTLDDSDVGSKKKAGGSAVDLAGKQMDDDELVLGGSGGGSDITLGGDSGISLVDPADSGLSLEQPLDLGAHAEESLELGEDDLLTAAVEGSGVRMKSDDFLLTPSQEGGDGEDSESGSQVIALDTEGDEAATMIGSAGGPAMAAMLEEDLSTLPAAAAYPGLGPAMPGQQLPMGGPGAVPQDFVALPETPYTGLNVTALVACSLLLVLCGMFMYDLMRNMWSWDEANVVNSSIMDTILGWFES